ncbi:hypothetical protein O3W44_00330 [Pantoea sp. LMR881]|uniref:hypothetical protein n=1 Tax=Pantoea sp. LMR881 TaxID=3014336 RepID=UPI0022AE66CE|nr:hypothetical protein [Pantoea sp. LMR881]MCZ4057848.1 hypothetical protein [Pantoea sp. LMR881]
MKSKLMTLTEMARYLGVSPRQLARAFCNRGSLADIPLPEALEAAPLTERHWLRDDVRQFKRALQLARSAHPEKVTL